MQRSWQGGLLQRAGAEGLPRGPLIEILCTETPYRDDLAKGSLTEILPREPL